MINKYLKNYLIFVFIFIFLLKKCFSNEAHLNLISILELNYPLEFTFEQKYQNDILDGWMVIKGNGKARTEFAPPNNNLIVADGKWIMFYDPEIDRTTYIPLDEGIFKALLKPEALAEDNIIDIKETKVKDRIIYTLAFNIKNAKKKIILFFDKTSKNLLGWRLYEDLNDFIEVKVINHKKFSMGDKKKLKKIFKLNEAKSKIGMEYFGPYENRKVKKFLGGGKLQQ